MRIKTREAMRDSTGCFGCLLLPPATIGSIYLTIWLWRALQDLLNR